MGATIESQHNKITRNTRSGGDDERDGEAVGRGRERGTVASLRQGAENRAHGKWGGCFYRRCVCIMQEDNALGYFVRMGITRKAVSAGSLDRGHNSFCEPPLRIEIMPFILDKKNVDR